MSWTPDGRGYCAQLPNVPAYYDPWMDDRMDMGEERSDMVHGGGTDDRTRRLLQVQRKYTIINKNHSGGHAS
ncbi:hypothetical protein Leryth_024608 [Lithospermum erythrorhizon]|nr:hypothetical protein Leryth_024608 [Lithospermum erythrorhizon]